MGKFLKSGFQSNFEKQQKIINNNTIIIIEEENFYLLFFVFQTATPFCFSLKSFPTLNKYWKEDVSLAHTPHKMSDIINTRLHSLVKQRYVLPFGDGEYFSHYGYPVLKCHCSLK